MRRSSRSSCPHSAPGVTASPPLPPRGWAAVGACPGPRRSWTQPFPAQGPTSRSRPRTRAPAWRAPPPSAASTRPAARAAARRTLRSAPTMARTRTLQAARTTLPPTSRRCDATRRRCAASASAPAQPRARVAPSTLMARTNCPCWRTQTAPSGFRSARLATPSCRCQSWRTSTSRPTSAAWTPSCRRCQTSPSLPPRTWRPTVQAEACGSMASTTCSAQMRPPSTRLPSAWMARPWPRPLRDARAGAARRR
mmetsp:Transcript_602/g.1576  ORF Transcript_602/g.1576 Transcript_602/m.1576 type:complete len:252 (+) Transcript_602:456-1211(+)